LPDQLVPVRDRVSFSKLDEVLPLPDLVGIQRESFDWLLNEGLKEVLEEVSPIEDFTEQFQLYFGKHDFKDVKFSEEECRDKDITYSQPLFVEATFVNKVTGEIKEQEVFMGDFPIMTGRGTFIINGTERVVVSSWCVPPASTSPRISTRPPTRTSSSPRSSRAAVRGSSSTWTRRTPSASASTASAARASPCS
jgi:DNA-directed RNA polymerase beta subunit